MTGPNAESPGDWREFGRRWLPDLVAVLVRLVHDPTLAVDLATETLADAHTRWGSPPRDEEQALVDVLELVGALLRRAADDERVSAIERRRRHVPAWRLTQEEAEEISRLAEASTTLPPRAKVAAEELARTAPSPRALKMIRPSGLVDPPPDRARSPHGA